MARGRIPDWLGEPDRGLLVWAVEPHFGGSHQAFLEGLAGHSRHRIALHTLPGRHWKWRMQGGAFSLGRASRQAVAAEGAPQVLICSDMLDVPMYLALSDPAVGRAPVILYFHENQLTYPLPEGVERDLTYGIKNLASAAAADRVLFNSAFHRKEFLGAARGLLRDLPDAVPEGVVDEIEAKSGVLPLGCDLRRLEPRREGAPGRWGDPEDGPLVLWNQRWEYDKAPGEFFRALCGLAEEGVRFRVAVAGPNQGLPTAEFVEARARLEDRIVQWGALPSGAEYASLLWAADVVVSTALHEFFGVAVVEAVYCGCRPVLPDRLSYPEIIPAEAHGRVLYPEGGLVPLLRRALEEPLPWSKDWQRTWVSPYDWANMIRRYDEEVWSSWEQGARRARFPGDQDPAPRD